MVEAILTPTVTGSPSRHPIVTEDLRDITAAPLPWENFSGKTILISGANGMVPAYLVESLLFLNEKGLNQPCRVLALVRDRQKTEKRFANYRTRLDLEIIEADLSQEIVIDEPVHYIVHGASPAAGRYFAKDPLGVLEPNVFGTQNLLKLAAKNRCRKFLFLSSGSVYGDLDLSQKPGEDSEFASLDPMEFFTCYGQGKRIGEHLCACWHQQRGVSAVSARLGHTYGPGMPLADGRVFTDFVDCVLAGKSIALNSDGSAIRHFCYLSDAARGLFLLLLQGQGGEAYNLVNTEAGCSIGDLAKKMCLLFPEKQLEMRIKIPSHSSMSSQQNGFTVDISKIRRLGWNPQVGVDEGFKRTVRSFQ